MTRSVLVLLVSIAVSSALHYGPRNVNHSIAIVGGGPTGIYMAMLLKEKGRLSFCPLILHPTLLYMCSVYILANLGTNLNLNCIYQVWCVFL